MSSGGGDQTTEVKINPNMAAGGNELQNASSNLFNQGTSGIYQGSRLAEYNPLIGQGEQQMLDYWGSDGQGTQTTNNAMNSYNQLLGAGDYDNPFLREQIESLTGSATDNFLRNVAPRLDQGSTAAGQYGSSRAGIAEGVAMGDTQSAIAQGTIQALLGGQQLALGANQLLPQMQQAGMAGRQTMAGIGSNRTMRDQAQLQDQIQQFEAPRTAELQRQAEYAQMMQMNPLMAEQIQTTQMPGADPWSQALGLGLSAAGMYFGGPAGAAAGSSLGSLLPGGVADTQLDSLMSDSGLF